MNFENCLSPPRSSPQKLKFNCESLLTSPQSSPFNVFENSSKSSESSKRKLAFEKAEKKRRTKKKNSVQFWELKTLSSDSFDFKRLTERQQISLATKTSEIGSAEDKKVLLNYSPFRLDKLKSFSSSSGKKERKSEKRKSRNDTLDKSPLALEVLEFSDDDCSFGTCIEIEDKNEVGLDEETKPAVAEPLPIQIQNHSQINPQKPVEESDICISDFLEKFTATSKVESYFVKDTHLPKSGRLFQNFILDKLESLEIGTFPEFFLSKWRNSLYNLAINAKDEISRTCSSNRKWEICEKYLVLARDLNSSIEHEMQCINKTFC